MDTNGDGFVTKEELKQMLGSLGEPVDDSVVNEMMAVADTNGDGKLRVTLFKLSSYQSVIIDSVSFFTLRILAIKYDLDNNFAKEIKSYLKINLYNSSIDEQYTILICKLLPLKLGFVFYPFFSQ